MPICERDPWRFQFFKGVPCPDGVNVPTDDIDCYEWFPAYRWVYDKHKIAQSQGLVCGIAGDAPRAFPVFAKPNINLRGMGVGSQTVHTLDASKQLPPDYMWMPLLHGDHISTDCAVVNGQVKWMRHALGYPWIDGMFRYWIIETAERSELSGFLSDWVARHMGGYTGMMNMETIGGVMIEAHLRFADQWCDLYGKPWLKHLVTLYAENRWPTTPLQARVGYSIPLFAKHGQQPAHPATAAQAAIRAMPEISSLQITFHDQKPDHAHPMPGGGFRLGLINCWDKGAGFQALDALAASFPGVEVMRQAQT
jgi:hypothetical protein